ncbi:MAG: 7TM diverse intracellular signaling domain-containing protein [Myxococcota bacterium]|nr:7TM diverse intracellular signaling domain-containing protein [Myxococcota bacterium]
MCTPVVAQVISLDPEVGYYSPKALYAYFEDETKTLTIDDIASSEIASKFERRAWEDRRHSVDSVSTWIRFTLSSLDRGPTAPDWFLGIGNPHIERLELYYPVKGNTLGKNRFKVIKRMGDPERPSRTILVRLPFDEVAEGTFYLRLDQRWRDISRIYFCTSMGRANAIFRQILPQGLFYGAMLVFVVVNLLFFFVLRDRSYLWQVLFLLSTMLFFFFDHGLARQYFPKLRPDLQWHFMAISISVMIIWFCVFSRSFLNTKKNTPRANMMLWAYIVLAAGLLLGNPLMSATVIARYVSVLGGLVPVAALIPGFICLRRGFRAARFYLAAWIVFSVTTPLAATVFMGTHWGGFLLQNGIVVTAFLMAIALFDRMRIMNKEREALAEANRIAEQQMMRADKMVALGQIMAGVAHEINNPNNFIHFNLPIMKKYVAAMAPMIEHHRNQNPDLKLLNMPYDVFIDDVYKLIDNMQHGSKRITKIVGELKEYVHGGEGEQKQMTPIEPVVDQVVALVGKQVLKTVKRFDVSVADGLPRILMNSGKIEQVLVNLIINAGHAADKEDAWIKLTAQKSSKQAHQVEVRIEDNGTGIPKDVQRRIFDPFFTTKERGVGTGLGLSISQKTVVDHGGTLTVESEVGQGTCFTLALPSGQPT